MNYDNLKIDNSFSCEISLAITTTSLNFKNVSHFNGTLNHGGSGSGSGSRNESHWT